MDKEKGSTQPSAGTDEECKGNRPSTGSHPHLASVENSDIESPESATDTHHDPGNTQPNVVNAHCDQYDGNNSALDTQCDKNNVYKSVSCDQCDHDNLDARVINPHWGRDDAHKTSPDTTRDYRSTLPVISPPHCDKESPRHITSDTTATHRRQQTICNTPDTAPASLAPVTDNHQTATLDVSTSSSKPLQGRLGVSVKQIVSMLESEQMRVKKDPADETTSLEVVETDVEKIGILTTPDSSQENSSDCSGEAVMGVSFENLPFPDANLLLPPELSPNVEMAAFHSDTSSHSDTDTVPSKMHSPCSIQSYEKDIVSPTMLWSATGEFNFSDSAHSGEASPDTNELSPYMSFYSDMESSNNDIDTASKQESVSESCALYDIQNHADNNSRQDAELFSQSQKVRWYPYNLTKTSESRQADGYNVDIGREGVLQMLKDDKNLERETFEQVYSLPHTDLDLYHHTTGVRTCAKPGNDYTCEIADSREDNVNNGKKSLVKDGKIPFWTLSSEDNNIHKPDTPTVTTFCESKDYGDEVSSGIFTSQSVGTEQSDALPQKNQAEHHSVQAQNSISSSIDLQDSENVHDEMLNIINELRRLSSFDDSEFLKYEPGYQGGEGQATNLTSTFLSTADSYPTDSGQRLNLWSDPHDLSPIPEVNEIKNSGATNSNVKTSSDPEHHPAQEQSMPVNVLVHWRNKKLTEKVPDKVSCSDEGQGHNINADAKHTQNSNSSKDSKSLSKCLADDTHVPDAVKVSDTTRNEGHSEQSNLNKKASPRLGIVRTSSKEAPESPYPKRVSFSMDNPVHEPQVSDHMVTPDISDSLTGNHKSETSFTQEKAYHWPMSLKAKNGNRNHRPYSGEIKKPLKLTERFQRALSLPAQSELNRSAASSDNLLLLDVSGADADTPREKQDCVDGHLSHDNERSATLNDVQVEPSDGTTNMAFVLESPDSKNKHNIRDTEEKAEEENEEDDKQEEHQSRSLEEVEEQLKKLHSQDNKKPERPIRQLSETHAVAIVDKNKRIKLFRKWRSVDEQASEASPLTGTPKRGNHGKYTKSLGFHENGKYTKGPASQKVIFDFENLPEDFDHEGTLPSRANTISRHDDNDDDDDDTLSLEFYVPGKRKSIRLHRRTFIHFVLKYSIFFFSFLFWAASLSAIGFGTWMLTSSNTVVIDDVTDLFLDPYVLLCVVGSIIFLVTFFGCVGALRENIWLLKLFHISLTGVLVLEVLLSALVFLFYTMPEFRMVVKVGPEEFLKRAVKEYFDNEGMKIWIDTVQKEFKCCGVSMSDNGYLDWQENVYFNCSDANPSVYKCSVPLSCCIFEEGDYINYMCGAGIMKKEESFVIHMINTKGCMKSFGEWLSKNDALIGYVALGIIIPQIAGVVAARYFIKNLLKRRTTWKQLSDPIQIVTPTPTPHRTS